MQHIRVSTFAGPGARPVIHSVPWPKIPKKAALIQIGVALPMAFYFHRVSFTGLSANAVIVPPH